MRQADRFSPKQGKEASFNALNDRRNIEATFKKTNINWTDESPTKFSKSGTTFAPVTGVFTTSRNRRQSETDPHAFSEHKMSDA